MKSRPAVVATAVLCLLALTAAAQDYPIPDGARVLWIGNSLIGKKDGGAAGYTDAALAAFGGPDTDWHIVANWGESLTWGLSNLSKYNTIIPGGTIEGPGYDPNTQLLITTAITNGHPDGNPWDYVILQGYGDDSDGSNQIVTNGLGETSVDGTFYETVELLDGLIQAEGAKTILYMRWANNPVVSGWTWFNTQTAALIENYTEIGAYIGAEVVPIAHITRDLILDNPPDLSSLPPPDQRDDWLYTGGTDNIHQGPYGKGMFAYAFAAVLSRESPVGQPFSYAEYINVPADIDQAIQESVWNILVEREAWAGGATVQILADTSSLSVPEGGTATFQVSLSDAPTSSVTITSARVSGDSDLTVTGGGSLVFTTNNWATPQTVTVSAAEDDGDSLNGSATIQCSAPGLVARNVNAVELDNDALPPGTYIFEEQGGVVTMEGEHYYGVVDGAKAWTLQVDGVTEDADLTGVRNNGDYMTVLPNEAYGSHDRSDAGPILLIDHDATIDYKVAITTTGEYRLYVRACGRDNGADTMYGGIVELRDGDGGGPLPDWYRYAVSSTGSFDWDGSGVFEGDLSSGTEVAAVWTFPTSGVYTVRLNYREDGVAVDALVLQRSNLAAPTGSGPAESPILEPDPDTDNDGIDDDWERDFFGDLDGTEGLPTDDWDGDLFPDAHEWRAGTNPTNAASLLAFTWTVPDAGQVELQWQSVPGKEYVVQRNTNLFGSVWSTASPVIPGLPGDASFTLSAPDEAAAYRILLHE